MSTMKLAIANVAKQNNFPAEWALAIVSVESAFNVYWTVGDKKVPAINIEPHYFYRQLTEFDVPGLRKEAVTSGLASKKAFQIKIPGSYRGRYDMLNRMAAIYEEAAYRSISMGVGQVMGSWYKRLGFKSAKAMFRVAEEGVAGQVLLLIRFCQTDPAIMRAIERDDFAGFAKLYNGPQYRRNNYDVKIAKAVRRFRANNMYHTGGEALDEILELGYGSVREFQEAHGISADGIVGPVTLREVAAARDEAKVAAANKAAKSIATKSTGVAVGVGGVGAVVENIGPIVDSVQPALYPMQSILSTLVHSGMIKYVVIAACVVGVIAGGAYVWKRFSR